MPNQEGLTPIIILCSILGPMLMLYLQHLSRQPASVAPATGNIVVDHHPINQMFGWGIIVIAGGIGIAIMTLLPIRTSTDLYLAPVLPGLFGLLGTFLVVVSRCRVELTDSGIEAWNAWRGKHSIGWDEVARVRFSPSFGCFTLTARGGESIHISAQLRGIPEFVRTLKCRLPPELLAEARAALDIHDK